MLTGSGMFTQYPPSLPRLNVLLCLFFVLFIVCFNIYLLFVCFLVCLFLNLFRIIF